jgi:signal transduction histidine kinase
VSGIMPRRRCIFSVAALTFGLLCFACQATLAAEPKRVLLIYNSVGYAELVARDIRAELEQHAPGLLQSYFIPFPAAREADESVTVRYADYLAALFPDQGLDLAVAVGSPAMNFFRQHGRPYFPTTPMLAIVEERRAPPDLRANETVVTVSIDLVGAVETILRVLPETNNISVVIGSSPVEQYWLARGHLAFQPFEGRVSFRWLNDLSFEEILKHAATLPPRSAILFNNLLRDAIGVGYSDHEVVTKLHDVAAAPIFAFDDTDFGQGNVGGSWPSTQDLSRGYADVALRILRGEALGGLKLSGLRTGPPKFDWREMQRWGISEGHLPPGSVIYFRAPTAWEEYNRQILAIGAAIIIQATLIGWLLHERQYRHRAERMARDTMSELTQMNRLATAGELSASIAHEINQPLTGMVLRASAALRWLAVDRPDIAKVRELVSDIITAGHRASDIVTSIRAMFKKETNEKGPVDINHLITAVLAIVQIDLKKSGIELRTQLDEQLPIVECDRVQVQQVVLNLVMNAIDCMHSLQPRVLKIQSERSKPDFVHVSIEDTGTGVDPSDVDRIFKPLFTTKTRGMGMGLSICRSIIESHDGRIWVSAGASRGSIFHFELPTKAGDD